MKLISSVFWECLKLETFEKNENLGAVWWGWRKFKGGKAAEMFAGKKVSTLRG